MAWTLSEIQSLKAYFQPILGRSAWNVALGHGSFVTMEFGEPLPLSAGVAESRETISESLEALSKTRRNHKLIQQRIRSANSVRIRGTWHLWVYCCAWRLETPDDVLAYCEDSRSRMAKALQMLEGKTLEDIEIHLPGGDTLLRFEGGLLLRLMPTHSEDYEHWMLYTPEGVLVFGAGTNWSFEPRT
jgi:hypothetical protein